MNAATPVVPLHRAALCLDCDAINELPAFETWRDRPSCVKCGSRSLVELRRMLERPS